MREKARDRLRMMREFIQAIDEAEAHAEAPTMSEQEPPTAWRKGYLMGLCIGAALAGMPKHVWASPERHERRQRT